MLIFLNLVLTLYMLTSDHRSPERAILTNMATTLRQTVSDAFFLFLYWTDPYDRSHFKLVKMYNLKLFPQSRTPPAVQWAAFQGFHLPLPAAPAEVCKIVLKAFFFSTDLKMPDTSVIW